jgi:hypothetical protein
MITVTAAGLISSSSNAGVLSRGQASPTTGNVSITCSKDGCPAFDAYDCENETLALTSLSVNVDVSTVDGHGLDAIKFGQGCSGTVGKVTCKTISEDCLKVDGASNLTIGGPGSSIRCSGHVPGAHQDGIQVTGGSDITFMDIDDACTTATNAQFYVNQVGSQIPTNIYFIGGILNPDRSHFNNVVINGSHNSGVIDSTICPDARPHPIQIGQRAVGGINRNNIFPSSCAVVHLPVCKVPKVKGKKLAKAKAAIKHAQCAVGKVKKAFSAKTKKGRVVFQKPSPGAKRSAGFKVNLTVSKGRRPTKH